MSGTGMNKTEEEQILDEAFDLFDKDGSGTICTSEFGMVLRAIGLNPSDEEIVKFVRQLDSNNSGRIEKDEFRDFYKDYKKKHKNSDEAIVNAFKLFDKDNNGFIEAKELKAILSHCGQKISDEEVEEMIAVADVDNDGKINYKEFAKFICQPIKEPKH